MSKQPDVEQTKSTQTVKATAVLENGEKVTGSVLYDFGSDLKEAAEKFGEDVVFKIFKQQAVIKLQHVVRTAVKAGKTPEEIQATASEWKPGLVVKADPVAALLKKVKSPEELQDIVAKLQARLAGE